MILAQLKGWAHLPISKGNQAGVEKVSEIWFLRTVKMRHLGL